MLWVLSQSDMRYGGNQIEDSDVEWFSLAQVANRLVKKFVCDAEKIIMKEVLHGIFLYL